MIGCYVCASDDLQGCVYYCVEHKPTLSAYEAYRALAVVAHEATLYLPRNNEHSESLYQRVLEALRIVKRAENANERCTSCGHERSLHPWGPEHHSGCDARGCRCASFAVDDE